MDKDKAIKEIKQLKELLDNGILTQEEYDKKSSDLKKIILDSQDEKNELSKSDKEYWEQKVKEKSNTEKEIIPAKKEEIKPNKQLVDKDEVVLKETTDELSNDSNKKDTIKTSGGFRKWLNKKESPLNNFLYIALGFIVIPTNFYVYMTFSDYIIGLGSGRFTYGEYPFDSNFVFLIVWFVMGTPLILLFSYLISLIKSLKVKTTKVFFLFTLFFLLVFLRSFQTTIYPSLNLEQNNVSGAQIKISEGWQKEAKKKEESGDFLGALNDYNNAIQLNPNLDKLYKNRGDVKTNLKDYDGAINDYNKAIDVNPYRYNNYIFRAISACRESEEYDFPSCVDCSFITKGWNVAKKNGEDNDVIKGIENDFPRCTFFSIK